MHQTTLTTNIWPQTSVGLRFGNLEIPAELPLPTCVGPTHCPQAFFFFFFLNLKFVLDSTVTTPPSTNKISKYELSISFFSPLYDLCVLIYMFTSLHVIYWFYCIFTFTVPYYSMFKISCMNIVHRGSVLNKHSELHGVLSYYGLLRPLSWQDCFIYLLCIENTILNVDFV